MDPLQTTMATVGLQAVAGDGFVLAGGYALRAHGFGDRDSDDIDLFTDLLDAERFAGAVERLIAAYDAEGLRADVARQTPAFARIVVTGPDGATGKADLGVDHRQFPPVVMKIGPVLSEQDAVGSKVGAVYSRLEPRDLIDVQAILDSGRYDRDTALALADQREVTPLDRPTFAGQLRAGSRLPDAGFTRYGAPADLIARIRQTAAEWADQLERAA
ncbi:nucleotidyl transferase AbiEii/AbiGii toxin family protein [Kribbella sp. CA-253562]|uniref:nucleotidyl transferase AbiEii/AbiGii toxin family protein n=1 Tax=Kribbella sp. CA-253562 TaxID=3239942 RepID=UPI003D89F7D6